MSIHELLRFLPHSVRNGLRQAFRSLESAFWSSDVTLKQPIFVWGVGRSGTFLVQDILSLHPQLCTVRRAHRPHKGLWGNLHYEEDTPEALKDRDPPHEGFAFAWLPAGVPPVWHGHLRLEDILIDSDKVYGLYRSLSRIRPWANNGAAKRVLDKAVIYIMMSEVMNALFPDAYHVFCIRDPRSTANSILRLWRYTRKEAFESEYREGFFAHLYPEGYEAHLGRPLADILGWQVPALIRDGFAARRYLGERLVPFRFESLLNDAHAAANGLFAATGLSPFPDIERLIPKTFADHNPPWPRPDERFTRNETLCFDSDELPSFAGLEQLAQALGYDRERLGQINGPIDVEMVLRG